MRRLAVLPLCVCLAATCWSGCQSARHTAHVEPPRPGASWSAGGESSRAELVSNRDGEAKVRFASRPGGEGGSSLSNFLPVGSGDRIPLPRTDDGALRNIDSAGPVEQPIGAF